MRTTHLLCALALCLSTTACDKNKKPGADSAGPDGGADSSSNPDGSNKDPDGPDGSDGKNPGPKNKAKSIAAFKKMGEVLTHPRCINCHPSGERPTQGDKLQPHQPPVFRGDKDKGEVGMRCTTCHTVENVTLLEKAGSVPGLVDWHMAPESMGWQGKTLSQICKQIKDRKLNGDKSLEEIYEHNKSDPLVGWAWKPGKGRKTPPGTWADFAKQTRIWIDNGAVCP